MRKTWVCPVCKESGGWSRDFSSGWAVACHVAGKVARMDRAHCAWTLLKLSEEHLHHPVFKLADELIVFVGEEQPGEPVFLEQESGELAARLCPACNTGLGQNGGFDSDMAVAHHIADEVMQEDRLHRRWVLQNLSAEEQREFYQVIYDYKWYRAVPKIAQLVLERIFHQEPTRENLSQHSASAPDAKVHLFQAINRLEQQLHEFIRRRLTDEYGQEDGWWVQGIPLPIREECVRQRERDPKRLEPYSYVYLIDLKTVLDKNWKLFERDLLRIATLYDSKGAFLDDLARINTIRNVVMHAARGEEPGEEDKVFVDRFSEIVQTFTGDRGASP